MEPDAPLPHIHAFRAIRLSDLGYYDYGSLGDLIVDSRCDCGLTPVAYLLRLTANKVEVVYADPE